MSIVQWKDSKVVYLGSNFTNIEPTKMVKRYSHREKKTISCVQPFCFYQHNQGMGGVDLLDRFISQYRPTIQTKKRYWSLFVNCIEMLTVVSWRLHVTVGTSPRLDFLEFIRSVVGGLLKTISSESSGPNGRRIINPNAGLHHPVNAKTQGHCSNCKKNTVKNVVFACILCASWITISNKTVFFCCFCYCFISFGVFPQQKVLTEKTEQQHFFAQC